MVDAGASRAPRPGRARVVAAVIVAVVALGAAVGIYLAFIRSPSGPSGSQSDVRIPAADFRSQTWGYVGCSNTRDTVWGYQRTSDARLFWPAAGYPIEGKTVPYWANPNDPVWQLFDREVQRFNGGQDPPVIWVQMCVDLQRTSPNYGAVAYGQVQQMLQNVRAHAPGSVVFASPLQSYDPPTLCALMGPDGAEISQVTSWLDQAVAQGLAHPGPGTGGIPNLGPLTKSTAFRDGCHPSGGPHGPGSGAEMLGSQLAEFFDHLPRS